MEKKERKIIYDGIEIPENVQKKAELAFLQIKTLQNERAKIMEHQEIRDMQSAKKSFRTKKIMKSCAAVAACAALVAAAGFGATGWLGEASGNYTEAGEASASNEESAAELSVLSKAFVLSVKAAELGETVELEQGTKVAVSADSDGWAVSGYEDGTYGYCINLPLVCEGDGIESVTYSINKGVFQVVEPEDDSMIVDGKEYTGEINTGIAGGVYDEVTGDALSVIKYYTEITLDYDRQESETTWINICRDHILISDRNLIWGENSTLSDQQKGYQELVEGVVITCTVRFADGTTETAELEAGAAIMTAGEAGVAYAADPDAETVCFTFERK